MALTVLFLCSYNVLHGKLTLSWKDNSNAETGFSVERAVQNSSFAEIAVANENQVSFVDTDVEPGVLYSYRIRAFNQFGYSSYSNAVSKKLPVTEEPETEEGEVATSGQIPSTLVGNHKYSGYHNYLDDVRTHLLGASGKGLQGYSDSFRFAYSSTEDDARVTLHIPEIATRAQKAQASLQFRQSLDPDSAYVALTLNHNIRAGGRWRDTNGAKTQATDWRLSEPANYLRLSRNGADHTLEASLDGFDWLTIANTNVQLDYPYLVGFGIASRDNDAVTHGVFEVLESNVPLLPPSYSKFGLDPKFVTVTDRTISTSYNYDPESLLHTLSAKGKGFEHYKDQLAFPSWWNNGSVRIAAQIQAFEPDRDWARLGLMIRSGSSSNSPFIAISINGRGEFEALWRNKKGNQLSTTRHGNAGKAPYLAIEYNGTTATLQYSRDGANWTTFLTKTIQFTDGYRVGPVLGSHHGYSAGAIEIIGLY